MPVTAVIQDTHRVQRGYFTLEQMSLLKPIRYTAPQKKTKANNHHDAVPTKQAEPPTPHAETPACVVTTTAKKKPQVAASAKPRATKRQQKAT